MVVSYSHEDADQNQPSPSEALTCSNSALTVSNYSKSYCAESNDGYSGSDSESATSSRSSEIDANKIAKLATRGGTLVEVSECEGPIHVGDLTTTNIIVADPKLLPRVLAATDKVIEQYSISYPQADLSSQPAEDDTLPVSKLHRYGKVMAVVISLILALVVIVAVLQVVQIKGSGYSSSNDDTNQNSTIAAMEDSQDKSSSINLKTELLNDTPSLLVGPIFITNANFSQISMPADPNGSNLYDDDDNDISHGNVTLVTRKTCILARPRADLENMTVLPPPYVIISHTAGSECLNQADCCQTVRNLQTYHFSKQFSDIGHQFLIGGDGRAYEGRRWTKYGAHTYGYNCDSFGITFIGNFVLETPRARQIEAAIRLVDQLVENDMLQANYTLYYHKQLSNTESPGAQLIEIVKKWPHWSSEVPSKPPCH